MPNTFDGVLVELGPRLTNAEGAVYFPVLKGLEPGDVIVGAGSFLIDAETRLNPAAGSIYIGGSGGGKTGAVRPSTPDDTEMKVTAALNKLTPADRAAALAQRYCPILEGSRLGSMGVPVKLELDGATVYLCCKGCIDEAKENPTKTRKRVEELRTKGSTGPTSPKAAANEQKIRKAIAELPPADRAIAELQRICPVTDLPLGSMGKPSKVVVKDQPVFTCCDSCDEDVIANPDEMLRKVAEYKRKK
jgi:hypothetical protein